MPSGSEFQIRQYEGRDEAAAYDVCLKTGDAGEDASSLYTDPLALGHIYVGPYLRLEPEFAYVLEDSIGVCGYVLGALDSKRFYDAYVNQWLPRIRSDHPEPSGDSSQWSQTEWVYHEYYQPNIFFPESFEPYPSHLHIDLLPRVQGKGQGVRMMAVLLKKLKDNGSLGVHLAMAASNHRAEKFYRRLGFGELPRRGIGDDETVFMGRIL